MFSFVDSLEILAHALICVTTTTVEMHNDRIVPKAAFVLALYI